jgi:acyl CoA:acetate/3-ketoacid CoA transferase alpha subunit
MALSEALERFVEPRMHLNFASTPSRSNAAIRELARRYRGQRPEFVFSATGFHSMAHLLVRLELGRRYIGCFFGDNYPTPRANRLYRDLARRGDALEHWSLWSYVSALRAGAFGHPYAITQSLSGTSIGAALALEGKFLELPDPGDPGRRLGLVRAITPDIVFLHAAAGDRAGNLLLAPPLSEGIHGALAARLGVIATVDVLLERAESASFPELVPLPPQRVLAVCEEPFGAHPQPLHFAPAAPALRSYRDDFAHYELWRALGEGSESLDDFSRIVLDAEDGADGYRRFVGPSRLESLLTRPGRARPQSSTATATATVTATQAAVHELSSSDRLLLLAARTIARRVRSRGLTSILAGLGQSFAAVRLAKLLLGGDAEEGPEVMIETGFAGLDLERANGFLLSQENVAGARRLASIDVMLGALTCGGQNRCLGVIGAAQVDCLGDVNSSFVGGEFLVGSGGACDIAASAEDVVVLTQCDRTRLVEKVEYVTSPGRRVRAVITNECVLERAGNDSVWHVRDILPSASGALTAQRLAECCPWPFRWPTEPDLALPPTAIERSFLDALRGANARSSQKQAQAMSCAK